MRLGVIVGRFQVPELHPGHISLFNKVVAENDRVLVVLGSPATFPTRRNPMDGDLRMRMIKEAYPAALVVELQDEPTNEVWSQNLDRIISWINAKEVTLYGSRESFIPLYTGAHPCVETEPHPEKWSGTAIRESIARVGGQTSEFRSGVIYAEMIHAPAVYQCVDVAVVHHADKTRLLLGRKASDPEGQYRFPGGFVDPKDGSLEIAAIREVQEETGVFIKNPRYLGSTKVDDWRYRNTEDAVHTVLFAAEYNGDGLPKADDDLKEVRWFEVGNGLSESVLVPSHRALFAMFSWDAVNNYGREA